MPEATTLELSRRSTLEENVALTHFGIGKMENKHNSQGLIRWVVFGIVIVGFGVGAFTIYRYATRSLPLPIVEAPTNPIVRVANAFPAKKSQLVLTARLPFAQIKDLAAQRIPRNIGMPLTRPTPAASAEFMFNPICPLIQLD